MPTVGGTGSASGHSTIKHDVTPGSQNRFGIQMAGFPHTQPLSKRSPFARMGTGITLCLALLATVLSAAASGQALTCDGKVATIVGTEGNDRIYGTDGDDVIVALGGIDIIRSFDGKDTICGGEGRDRIYAGRGADVIFGEGQNDRILGQAGADIISGGPGRDTLLGGGGNDDISAGGGNDKRIEGGPGADTLNGGSGNDRCAVEADDDGKRCELDLNGTPTDDGGGDSSGGGGSDDPPQDPDLAQLYSIIEGQILPNWGANNPWIVEAWNYIDANGTVAVDQTFPGGYVETTCRTTSFNSFTKCEALTMTIGKNAMTADVIIHELAHVYERTTDLPTNRSALAVALLYIEETYPDSSCPSAELIADAMLHLAKPDAYLPYWRNCAGVPATPSADDEAVLAAGLSGVDPAWFTATFANGAQAWSAIVASPDKYELAGGLADFFGGYCSTSHTNEVLFGYASDDNPYSDGGC